MAGGDHHPGIKSTRLHDVGQARSRDHAGVDGRGPARGEPAAHGVAQPRAGLARVPPERQPARLPVLLLENPGQRLAEAEHARPIQRGFPGDAADTVGPEQSFHDPFMIGFET